MSWVSDCAERWVGKGGNEEEAINGAITETLVKVLQLCDVARVFARAQGNFIGDTGDKAFEIFADTVRALMANG